MARMSSRELQLGDIVRRVGWESEPYTCATVKQVKDGNVILFRPYVKTEDFSYTGGVITYVGIEEYTVPIDDHVCWELLRRVVLK